MTVRGVTPIFVVRDLKETMAFYTDVLGMETAGVFPQTGEPTWCSMRLDDASVAFTFEAPHTHEDGELHVSEPAFAGSLYFYTDDVDALYDRIKEKVEIDEARSTDRGGCASSVSSIRTASILRSDRTSPHDRRSQRDVGTVRRGVRR
jgi:catechol 2,3-dioxygenase-like lactoylglutathione lyase family enzyme